VGAFGSRPSATSQMRPSPKISQKSPRRQRPGASRQGVDGSARRRNGGSGQRARSPLQGTNFNARHTTNPPDSCLSRPFSSRKQRSHPTVPPGGRFWHGFAVRRPPVGRGGRGLTFGLLGPLEPLPMHRLPALDIGGMERKSASPNFFTERTLADFLAVSDRTIRNWIRRGELPSYKLGAARRIDPADVEDFLAPTETRRREARFAGQAPEPVGPGCVGCAVHRPRWQAPHSQAILESRQRHLCQERRSAESHR
jgi:excisionase family DNA binding protein